MILSPIFIPLGFGSWGAVSALIAGLVAKEIIVSSIAMFNGVDSASLEGLQSSLLISTSAVYFAGYSSAISFLTFCLLYFPCIATFSVLVKEIGMKWTSIGVLIEFVVAYCISFVIYTFCRCCETFGFIHCLGLVLLLLMLIASVVFITKKIRKKKCPYIDKCGKCNF